MSYQSIFKPDLFEGQRIIVTGGGSGIGRCIAHELASLGAELILTGRTLEKLQTVKAEIEEDGGKACCHAFDIRDEDGVKTAIEAMLESGPAITGLVNNAGGQFPSLLETMSTNGFEAVVRTNAVGAFNVSRELLNQSMKKTGGAIVNITADFWDGMPMMGHTGAARAACDNFTKTAAVEWGHYGVRVNSVAPGWVASSGMDTYENPVMTALIPEMKKRVPLGHMATEAEISGAVCFLLSEAASFISGASLRVDGGASRVSSLYPLQTCKDPQTFQGFHRYKAPKVVEGDQT